MKNTDTKTTLEILGTTSDKVDSYWMGGMIKESCRYLSHVERRNIMFSIKPVGESEPVCIKVGNTTNVQRFIDVALKCGYLLKEKAEY
jgi:hypothetical protein